MNEKRFDWNKYETITTSSKQINDVCQMNLYPERLILSLSDFLISRSADLAAEKEDSQSNSNNSHSRYSNANTSDGTTRETTRLLLFAGA